MGVRTGRERGSSGLEYIGIALAVAALVAAVGVFLGPRLEPEVARAWCLVTGDSGSDCSGGGTGSAAAAGEDLPWFADPALTPEERATAGRYVGLGDSYSSGEGGSAYEPGTDEDNQWKKWWDQHGLWPGEVRQNMCHRSTAAYSQRVNADQGLTFKGFGFAACSGAVIDDFYRPNHENHNADSPNRQNEDEPAQLDSLTEDTSLVTFSIGGNDVGFADVLTECVKATAISFYDGISGAPPSSCADSDVAAEARGRIPDTAERLTQLLADARERAPGARIIVVGYPKFFPADPSGVSSMIQADDQRWINGGVEALNDALAEAVEDAGGPDAGFEFVDPRDAFAGCEIGTADSCMNGLRVGFGDDFDSGRPVSNGSFHPNDEGHRRIADLIADRIRNGG
ncbi:SGNH/GDSL hydrolase family protein [Phycicoccus sp. BSK3Z-2]|uniref:SGNH/GDSL hydrolase family protein n=1 Tax=Phycicoccus avicenniae TaxID=2828860 RepID=A0A941DDU7_9MICO|nr:SGNH/GDSL hydrolase family protein [Phycicoccus avicenniae]MBR7744507.1 SGNH/GDSL hydrolase family protein [Phycicoccus avicenniae]